LETVLDLEKWRRELLDRLEDLQYRARQIQQYMQAENLGSLNEKPDEKSGFQDTWTRLKELFLPGFTPGRADDLDRHILFAELHDFRDIELNDIPAVRASVEQFGRTGSEFIENRIAALTLNDSVSAILHPSIRDACIHFLRDGHNRQAAEAAVGVFMDELRRRSGETGDGDSLIRAVIQTRPGKMAFSQCDTDSAKNASEGLKQIAQGLYKGVRNPVAHGWDGYGRQEVIQVLVMCSLLLGRLQIVENESNS
jgi:uncharacterized protein (TIGR02391 family)